MSTAGFRSNGQESSKILPTPTPTNHPSKGSRIVIVGAGCFGLSTAYHLLIRGYSDITILDRSTTVPAPDAASNDLNRIVRSAYADMFYAELAREAIAAWKDREKWGSTYDESGFLVLGRSDEATGAPPPTNYAYADKSYENDVALGSRVQDLPTAVAIREVFPDSVRTGSFDQCAGYLNLDGGWANAEQGLVKLLQQIETLGGKVSSGKMVSKLLRTEEHLPPGRVTGVQCTDGSIIGADIVVVATGSWTQSAFPDLDLENVCLATGQSIAMIELSEEEADRYRRCPVVMNFSSGFYIFPPTQQNIVKMAIHAPGYINTHPGSNSTISTPRTISSDPERGLCIPLPALRDLRRHLREVYPDLADKPFSATRLCWYNVTPDENWIIARHPSDPSIVVATGGSGHAYKYLPVIGRLVADLVDRNLDPDLEVKFGLERELRKDGHSGIGQLQRLDTVQLSNPEDLLV